MLNLKQPLYIQKREKTLLLNRALNFLRKGYITELDVELARDAPFMLLRRPGMRKLFRGRATLETRTCSR